MLERIRTLEWHAGARPIGPNCGSRRLLAAAERAPGALRRSNALDTLLDGWRGFLMACLAAQYVRLKWAKLLILQRDVRAAPPPE